MTTKQKLEHLLLLAADSEPDAYVGGKVEATIEGKKVVVQRTGYGRKVYGKRAPEFDAWVDGERTMLWKHGKKQVLDSLFPKVSEEYMARQKAEQAEFARQQKLREAKEAAERKAKQEREAPARELANELMDKAFARMVVKHGKQFTSIELGHFLERAVAEQVSKSS